MCKLRYEVVTQRNLSDTPLILLVKTQEAYYVSDISVEDERTSGKYYQINLGSGF